MPLLRDQQHIAIIQTAFLGDAALSLWLAQEIKQVNPTCSITWVATPQAAVLGEWCAAVDSVLPFDKRHEQRGWRGMDMIARELASRKVQCVFALQRSARTSIVAKKSGALLRIGFKENALGWLYTHRVPWVAGVHEVERNRQLLSVFSDYEHQLNKAPTEMEYSFTKYIDDWFDGLGLENTQHYVALAIGSVWRTKRWSASKFEELALRIREADMIPVFIGSATEQVECSNIAARTGGISLAGACTLVQTLRVLKHCTALVTNDSAPTHLAGLVGTPTITIYGATSPAFGFAPRGVFDRVVENSSLACKPCAIHGSKICPLGTMECMESIESDTVFSELTQMIETLTA